MAEMVRNIKKMLSEIRQVLARYADAVPERVMYVQLLSEADGWQMRLDEIEQDSNED